MWAKLRAYETHALRLLPLPSYTEMSSQGVIAATLASLYSLRLGCEIFRYLTTALTLKEPGVTSPAITEGEGPGPTSGVEALEPFSTPPPTTFIKQIKRKRCTLPETSYEVQ